MWDVTVQGSEFTASGSGCYGLGLRVYSERVGMLSFRAQGLQCTVRGVVI